MKTALLTLALAAASLAASAQSKTTVLASAAPVASAAPAPDAFTTMMTAVIAGQNAAGSPADVLANLAKLERAVAAAPTTWEPRYYQARGYLKMGFMGQDDDQKDKFFDQAQAALDAAKKLPGADQAEVLILQAYIYQGRIMVSPMTRGMVYTGKVAEALGQAKKLSPDNPRLFLLLGNDSYYRPSMFGGGPDKALPMYEKAKTLFATFKPANALSPTWGEKMNDAMLARATADIAADK
jgi:hypothetical protein